LRQTLLGALAAGTLLTTTGSRAETLEEALVKTYQSNPDLAAERAALRATDEQVSKARSRWWPSLNAKADYSMSTESGKDGGTHYNSRSKDWSTEIVAEQPLLTGGRNGAERRSADAHVMAARARLRGREQRVLLDAASAYATIVRNEAVLDVVRADIGLLQGLLKDITDRHDIGKATDSDVDQTLAALEAARAQCLAHHASLQNSWRNYEQIVGEPPAMSTPSGETAAVSPCIDALGDRKRSLLKMPEKLPQAPASLADVEAAAQGNVPDLEEARAEEAASRGEVSSAYAELLPHAGLSASVGMTGQDYDPQSIAREATVSATVRVPLFNSGAEWSDIRAARERANEARLKITSAQRQTTRDALTAWYDLVSIRAVRAVNKAQAQTVLRAFNGLREEMADPKLHRSITDLLGLRQFYLGTQISLLESNRDEAISLFKLLASIGRLNVTDLKLPVEAYDPDKNLKRQSGRFIGDSIYGE
jgi:outer membrane protein